MSSKKCLSAVLAGAFVVFLVLNLSWMVLEWHGIRQLDPQGEAAAASALTAAATEGDAIYVYPPWKDADGKLLPQEEFQKRAEKGPFAFMVIAPEGKPFNMASNMLVGFFIQLVGALILCFLMLMASGGSGSNFRRRAAVGACFGLAVGLMPALANWNWWHFPTGYTLAMTFDALVGWTLGGLAMAKILEVKRPTTDA